MSLNDVFERMGTPGMTEFRGPNFNENGYSDAHYRVSRDTVDLSEYGESVVVPKRVEVENVRGEWQQHPVVFVHYGSRENEKQGRGFLVVFCANGAPLVTPYRPAVGDPRKLTLDEAERLGLTQGNRANIKNYVRESD